MSNQKSKVIHLIVTKKMNLTVVSKKKNIVEWLISKEAISLVTNKINIMLVMKSEPKLVAKKRSKPNISE